MKKIIILALTCICLTSCNQVFYQVYKVESPDLKQSNNSMVYENDDCKIAYNLWGKNGTMGFVFENKTDQDLFIDMTQTFFIKNGAANDYFKNRTYETRTYEDLTLGYSVSNAYIGLNGYFPSQYAVPVYTKAESKASAKNGISSAVTVRESEYVCVPAKSYKVIDYYHINPIFERTCDNHLDYPSYKSQIKSFTINESPLKFKNRIAYSFKKDNKELKHVENSFWLSEIVNYSEKGATQKQKVKEGCSDFNTQKKRFFKIGGPNQFYVSYYRNMK